MSNCEENGESLLLKFADMLKNKITKFYPVV